MIGRAPLRLRPWLLARGSLTRHLRRTAHGRFRVEPVGEAWVRADARTAAWLGVRAGQRVWRREVRLLGMEREWVHAHTLANAQAWKLLRLDRLGNRSLGSVLYRRGAVRARFELMRVPASGRWARLALHALASRARLLVTEVFAPDIPARLR